MSVEDTKGLDSQKEALWTAYLVRQMKTPDGLMRLLQILKGKDAEVELLKDIRLQQYQIEDRGVDEIMDTVSEVLTSTLESDGADVVDLNQRRLEKKVESLTGQRQAHFDRVGGRYNDLVTMEDETLDLEKFIDFAIHLLENFEVGNEEMKKALKNLGKSEKWRELNYLRDFLLGLEEITPQENLKELFFQVTTQLLCDIRYHLDSIVAEGDDVLIKVLKYEFQINVEVDMDESYKVQKGAFQGFPSGTQVPKLFIAYLKLMRKNSIGSPKVFYSKWIETANPTR